MRTLILPPDMQAAVDWLQQLQDQSWNAPPPPPMPTRPTERIAQAFYDNQIAPNWGHIVGIWQQLRR